MRTYIFKIVLKNGPVIDDSIEANSSREAQLKMEARYPEAQINMVGTR